MTRGPREFIFLSTPKKKETPMLISKATHVEIKNISAGMFIIETKDLKDPSIIYLLPLEPNKEVTLKKQEITSWRRLESLQGMKLVSIKFLNLEEPVSRFDLLDMD